MIISEITAASYETAALEGIVKILKLKSVGIVCRLTAGAVIV